MKKNEKIFSVEGACDSKHILNTCNEAVPQSLLDKIEAGCSIETIEEIARNKFDVFKYKTQITIHGLFPELSTNKIGGYVNLVQNKNKSIGVRYSAIDHEKKSRLFALVVANDNKWHILKNSTQFKLHRYSPINKDNRDVVVAEYKALANKIDTNLFVGDVECYISSSFFGTFINLELNIKTFYEKDFELLAEQICSKPFAEIEQGAKDAKEQRLREKMEREARYAEREAARAAEEMRRAPIIEAAKADFLAAHQGWDEVHTYAIQAGDELAKLVVSFDAKTDTAQCRFEYYRVANSFGRMLLKPLNSDGSLGRGCVCRFFDGYKKSAISGVLSASPAVNDKAVNRATEAPKNALKTAKKVGLNLQLVDYSEKAIAVTGDTKSIKDELKNLGGRFNPRLSCGAGWIFSAKKRTGVEALLARFA